MNTRVFRLDLKAEPFIDKAITVACDKQLEEGFKLVSTFIWEKHLILIFQKS